MTLAGEKYNSQNFRMFLSNVKMKLRIIFTWFLNYVIILKNVYMVNLVMRFNKRNVSENSFISLSDAL